jgi:hypothetical protein
MGFCCVFLAKALAGLMLNVRLNRRDWAQVEGNVVVDLNRNQGFYSLLVIHNKQNFLQPDHH